MRFAFFIPPPSHGERELLLRTIGAHMALELKVGVCALNVNLACTRLAVDLMLGYTNIIL